MNETPFSLEDRILCSDGACIGLVGADGLCKVCGKAYEGDVSLLKKNTANTLDEAAQSDDTGPTDGEIEDLKKELIERDLRETNDEERICCPDDMCIGIIGKDGKCGTCGKQT